jgi:hypothetical protein
VRAAAIMLPILIVQDWVSVWAFRRDFDVRNLVILMPGALIGLAAGWLLAARVNEAAVRLAVGLISIGFVVFMLARDRMLVDFVKKVSEICRGKAYFTNTMTLGQFILMDFMKRKTMRVS